MTTKSCVSLGFAGLAAAGLAFAASPAEAAGQLSFERVDAVVGSPTNAIRASDLNADGRLDLVVSGGQRVFVLTGRGDGRFDPSWSGAAGENPSDLAIADLDDDGLADLAVANHETDYVTLLFGIGGGRFEHRDHSRFRVNVLPHPHAVRLHDTDADGHADLLVDDRSPGSVRLFRGRGDGTFSGPTMIDVGGDPYRGMTLADVTGDGLADLLTPNPDHVAIVAADEDGEFRPRATLPAPFGPFSVVAADLDGDGRHDVAAASGEGRGTLATWHGLVDGSFRAAGRYEIARGPTTSAAADLTGDGRAEVIVACYAGGEVAVLIGGETPLVHRVEVGGNPYGLATGDFDGDGWIDFAVANDGRDYVSVFLTRQGAGRADVGGRSRSRSQVREPRGGRPQSHLRGHPGHPGHGRRHHLRAGLPGCGGPRLRLRRPVPSDEGVPVLKPTYSDAGDTLWAGQQNGQ